MERPKIQDYKEIYGAGAYDYVADVNNYINHLESKINVDLGSVVGRSEQLKAFLEWQQNKYIKPYDTPIAEQLEDYQQSL